MLDCIVTYTPNGTPVVHIAASITDNGIDNLIRFTLPLVLEKDKYWVCAISGYEDDERELYEVTEVRAFCHRLVERGFIASLHPTTLFFKDETPELGRFLGGMEVWAISKNLLDRGGNFFLTKELFAEWEGLLKKAEKRALALVRPQDGQHSTSIPFSVN